MGGSNQNMANLKVIAILVTVILVPMLVTGQNNEFPFTSTNERGIPYIQRYTPDDYNGHYQNWDMVQDENGLIYVANGDGILEYDGASWRMMSLSGFSVMRSLAIDKNNRLYFGSSGDFGYLEPDSVGEMQLVSLKGHIPQEDQDFSDVWNTYVTDDGVLFHTFNKLFLWRDNRLTVIKIGEVRALSWKVREDIYFHIGGEGLTKWGNDTIALVPDGHKFKNLGIHAMLPFEDGHTLICTAPDGLYRYNGTEATHLPYEINQYLVESRVYQGLRLPSGMYALGTIQNGIIIMDNKGGLVSQIAEDEGLGENIVLSVDLDRQRGLWTGTYTGLSRLEIMSPYRLWDDRTGLNGGVFAITRHLGRLHVATNLGVYYLQCENDEKPGCTFNRYPLIRSHNWALLSVGESLIVASSDGVYEVRGNDVKKISSYTTDALHRSRIDSNRVYVGMANGLSSIYLTNGTWTNEGKVEGIGEEIRSIAESPDGKLWLGALREGLLRVEFPQLSTNIPSNLALKNPVVKRYSTADGLPEGSAKIFSIEGKEYIGTDKETSKYSVFQFDEKSERFLADSTFGERFGVPKKNVFPIGPQDANGYFWMAIKSDIPGKTSRVLAKKGKDGLFTTQHFHEERFGEQVSRTTYLDHKGIAWFGGETLVQYDLNSAFNPKTEFNAFVRRVNTNKDSVIYHGNSSTEKIPVLSHAQNALRLEFSAATFEQEALNQFQYKLEGFDKEWSDWSLETRKDYTNLTEGNFTFKVRAKNIYNAISKEDSYSFAILPPWFRTWWAYLLYSAGFMGFIVALVRWRSYHHIKEKEKLEKIIAERTEEVKEQAGQLQAQKEKLQELDKTKSRFFANISHEFRTPLTLILGTLEDQIVKNTSPQGQEDLHIMRRNAKRLQRLINQLLDLSKLEAGSLQLEVCSRNIHEFLHAVVSTFNSHAHQRGTDFVIKIPTEPLQAHFDPDKVENIVYNLLSNAFKFTPDDGKIEVRSWHDGKNLSLAIQDTGPGMAKEQTKHIFDRFYQADDSNTREKEGTGIGLALTKELATLHHGEIKVESRLNTGSTFTFTFPIEKDQYDLTEIKGTTGNRPTIKNIDGPQPTPNISLPNNIVNAEANAEVPIILVVEDNKDLRNYIHRHLSGFKVLEAGDGLTGLQSAQQHVPDLVISDVMMPKMDGVTLLHHLKADEKTSHIPVILLTAKADTDSKIEGLETGADDYLTKPFNAQELKIRINNLINQRKSLKALFSRRVTLEPKDIAITSADEKFLKRSLEIIEQNIDNSDFDVETFQKAVGMSRMQLHRKIKALTDCSTSEFIRVQRLKRAAQMLAAKTDNISQIAYLTGFNNLSYFAKCFKEQFGLSPSDYMQQKTSQVRDS